MSSTLEDLRLPAAAATKIDIGGMLLALVPPMSMRVCRQRKKALALVRQVKRRVGPTRS